MCVGKVASDIDVPEFRTRKQVTGKLKIIDESGKLQYHEDILAVSTYYTKVVLFWFGDLFRAFQETTFYKILFHTTQPAHLVTALAVIVISFLSIPSKNHSSLQSPLWNLVYLGSFSAHFGAQLWMTFVSGLSLYFALPRHTFGNVQQILFPKYFLLNSALSLTTLAVFLKGHNHQLTQSTEIAIQAAAMVLCFLTELVIRLYLTPPLLYLMAVKNQMEKDAGVGMEVGKFQGGSLLKCPHYLKIHKSFRKVHMTIAMGNIVAMGCTMLHLYYLSQKLCTL